MCNEIPKSVADSIGPSEFDEETWLIAPPSDVTSQNSGRILEWLQVSFLKYFCEAEINELLSSG